MSVDDRLERLAKMSPADLRAEWQSVFRETPPHLPPSLLQRVLTYRVQEQANGGLPAGVKRIIDQLSRDPSAKPIEPSICLKPGTRLLREWAGKVHTVHVTNDGLLYEDRRYASLSHIAREITGAHWSGPRFFGLKRPVHPPRRVAAHG